MKFYELTCRAGLLSLLGTLALGLISGPAQAEVDCTSSAPEFVTVTVPGTGGKETVKINRKHVFCGEVSGKKKLKAKGFHSRPDEEDPVTVDLDDADFAYFRTDPDDGGELTGLYNISFFKITDDGHTKVKAVSTMFPDDCSYDDVLTAIANASNSSSRLSGDSCLTVQGEEFPIQVYWLNGYINSAFPIVQ